MQGLTSANKVVVTGARGFIGRRLLAPLVVAGAEVTALVRSGHDRSVMQAAGARVAIAPIRAGAVLDAALAGQDVLVNLAYDMRAGMADNLATFETLMAAAGWAGIGRVVHISSAVVYDGWPDGVIDENSPITEPGDSSYRQAKISMENSLLNGVIEAAILQPTIVYGPGSAMWTTAPMAALTGGGVVLPEPVGNCAAVYVDDVIQAILGAATCTSLGRERFLISGADPVGWDEFYRGYRDILGQGDIELRPVGELLASLGEAPVGQVASGPSMAARISASLRRAVGSRRFEAIQGRVRGLRKSSGLTYPDRHMLELYRGKPAVSIAKARSVLGYEPDFDLARAMAAIARDHS